MKLRKLLATGFMAMGLMANSASYAANFTAAQQADIEKIVHDYLVNNPQVLVEVSQALQNKEQQTMMTQAKTAISANAKQLFTANSPVVGNPKGDVTLVEFFDYQCVHCQESASVVKDLIKQNKQLRVILKEFPIFGSNSEYAAKAALASVKQGKFVEFHEALMKAHRKLSESSVLDIAKSVGLDTTQLKTDMNSKEIADELKANVALAEAMHLMATPIFIISQTPNGTFKDGKTFFIPGAVGQDALQNYIKEASNS